MSDQNSYPPPDDEQTRRRPELINCRSAADRIPATPTQQAEKLTKSTPAVEEPEPVALSVPWWGFVVVILVVAGITCGLWGFVLLNRSDGSGSLDATATPIFVVITATPTLSSSVEETAIATDVPIPELSPTDEEFIAIQVGSTIQVEGTDGSGLSLRQGPGLNFTTFFIGDDGEFFHIQEGPEEADGYIWWYLTGLDDPDREGWAVDLFLEVVNP